eukprot:GEMP01013833.1.p1 GENE.GEMP01013833.1~~GEMP01013833.1.p1  ORF type:complete len:426 (+),score=103.99 GEMP01013833.1:173-1450(+)
MILRAYSERTGWSTKARLIEHDADRSECVVKWLSDGNTERIPASWVASGIQQPGVYLNPDNQHLFKVRVVDNDASRPESPPAWARRAVELFKTNGFVVLENGCGREVWEPLLTACRAAEIKCKKLHATGNRDFGRWSFGVTFGSTLNDPAWLALLRVPAISTIVPLIFPNGGDCVSAGGDFCIPQKSAYQKLHSDITVRREFNIPFPSPFVCVNVAVQECTVQNGAVRIIPGSNVGPHARQCPVVENESEESKMSRALMRVGDILVRDVRTLHGGTPNHEEDAALSRYLPSIEFASHELKQSMRKDVWPCVRCVPQAVVDTLPDVFRPFMKEVLIEDDGALKCPPMRGGVDVQTENECALSSVSTNKRTLSGEQSAGAYMSPKGKSKCGSFRASDHAASTEGAQLEYRKWSRISNNRKRWDDAWW